MNNPAREKCKLTGFPILFLLLWTAYFMVSTGQASATITQGDFSIDGNLREQWAGRWGEGSTIGGKPTTFGPTGTLGIPGRKTGGSFDFNRWDLVEAKSVLDMRPSYHVIKNFKLLDGRLDTLFIKDADFDAIYRAWYDAFPDFKHRGIAPAAGDWPSYTQKDKVAQFLRNDLREYYAQINVTDDFGVRIGKQQVIWTEADALSGSEIINPNDLRFHFIHFESPEELRIPIQMVKFNYTLPDFWKTGSNHIEAFWIPGDFQSFDALGFRVNATVPPHAVDARSPYVLRAVDDVAAKSSAFNAGIFNQEGQPINLEGNFQTSHGTFSDESAFPVVGADALTATIPGFPLNAATFLDFNDRVGRRNTPSRSLSHSEFGVRYSTLLRSAMASRSA